MNLRRCFLLCASFFAVVWLTACTSTSPGRGAKPALSMDAVNFAPHFSMNGRISVRVNDKLDSGQIRWQRNAEEERVGLYSPLGSQVAELVNNKVTRMVTLRQGRETVTATSVGELTQSFLGVAVDLDQMAEWVQGVRLIENQSVDRSLANGDTWRVTAERYQVVGAHRFASRVTATNGATVVRLVIDEWAPQ